MTTAERLIRNLSDAARERVQTDQQQAKERIEKEISFGDLPVPVRKALLEFQRAKRAMAAAETIIEAAGYEAPRNNNDIRRGGLQQPYAARREAERKIMPTFTPRFQKIRDLQNRAAVAVMDKRGTDAQAVVEKLRKDLAEV